MLTIKIIAGIAAFVLFVVACCMGAKDIEAKEEQERERRYH